MNKKLLLIIGGALVLAAATIYWVYPGLFEIGDGLIPAVPEDSDVVASVDVETNATSSAVQQTKQTSRYQEVDKESFSIGVPSGWQEVNAAQGVLLKEVNQNENFLDEAARKASFKSYFAVTNDILKGRSLKEYAVSIKQLIGKLAPNTNFSYEGSVKVAGKDGYAVESGVVLDGIDFRNRIVLINGLLDDVWVLSFNTVDGYWNSYKEDFVKIADSFKIKK